MIQNYSYRGWILRLASCVAIGGVIISAESLVSAQINPDRTLGEESSEVNSVDIEGISSDLIQKGAKRNANLFHSFEEFNVGENRPVYFDNPTGIERIFSRVTGNSRSEILGVLGVWNSIDNKLGNADLFLINPNGIIFGSNASLNLNGSFIATTASSIKFGDGSFSATEPSSVLPLLLVNVPIGLQFRENPGSIINQSIAAGGYGLQVSSGKTLALVGSDVFIEGGVLAVREGRIEIGSVAAPAFVSLTPIPRGWALGYEGVQNFQTIQLSQGGVVFTETFADRADILLYGKEIKLVDKSEISSFNNENAAPSGMIALNASESIEIGEDSNIKTRALSTGGAADILIKTKQLVVRDDSSFIDTATEGDGQGGNLIVNAAELVELDGNGGVNQLTTQSFGRGDAGSLKVTTRRLILRNGGQLISSTSDAGNGGTISIEASEFIEVSGQGKFADGEVGPSGLFARTRGDEATGSGGVININTSRLAVRDGGAISVASVENSTGQAGTLNINADHSVEISGVGSTLLAISESSKPAGNLTINTEQLSIQNGGEVSVSGKGEGAAGNLQISASSIRLSNRGFLSANTQAGEGNITLQARNIILRYNSNITTDATGEASGGNITINTGVLAALENSDILANAQEAQGGKVSITAQGIFGTRFRNELTSESDITAISALGDPFSGTVELNTPEVDPSRGITELPANVVDSTALIAQNPCKKGAESEFTVTGRGGLPPSINEDLSNEATQVGLVEPASTIRTEGQIQKPSLDTAKNQNPIVPAQGWVFNDKGEVVLTAYNPNVTEPQRIQEKSDTCTVPASTQ